MVSKCFGYFSEYQEVTGTPGEVMGLKWALGERREREKERGGRAPTPCPIRFGQGGDVRHLVALLPSLH